MTKHYHEIFKPPAPPRYSPETVLFYTVTAADAGHSRIVTTIGEIDLGFPLQGYDLGKRVFRIWPKGSGPYFYWQLELAGARDARIEDARKSAAIEARRKS